MSRSARRHQRQDDSQAALSAYDKQVIADSAIMYLPLSGGSGGISDQTGNGHTGQVFSAPPLSIMPNGEPATVFDGATQYVEVPDSDALSVVTTGILTIEAWMRPDTLQFTNQESTGYVHWLGKNTSGQSEYVARMYSLTTTDTPPRPNRISGYSFNLSGGLGTGSYFQDAITAGEWIHYVLVINSINTSTNYPTGYTKVYKDGAVRDQDALQDYNIVPANGTAPFRIATASLSSFFQGAIAKVAVYNYELSATTIHDHYRMIVPATSGSVVFIKNVGSASTTATGTTLVITVSAAGVSAGSTLLVKVIHAFTSGGPTMADSRGNTYTRDITAPSSGSVFRVSLFSAQINSALQAGDTIQLTTSASVGNKAFSVDEFTNITFSSPSDVKNSGTGSSTTPGTSTTITTTNADDLIYGFAGVGGPTSDSFTEDSIAEFNSLVRVGTNSGSADVTANSAYKSVAATGAYKYQPTLGTSRSWVAVIAAYKAGVPVIVPPVSGTASFIQLIGSATAITSGTTLVITVPTGGVPIGHTLFVRTAGDHTSAGATMADSRGNTYTRDRSAANAGTTMRASLFSCPITTALQEGDTITVTWPSAISTRVAVVDEFASVLTPTSIDVQNGNSGTSTTPSTNVTTTNANDLLVGMTSVEGPTTETYTADTIRQWTNLTRTGTTASPTTNKTVNGAYRAVGATGTYTHAPILGTSASWINFVVAYRAV